jgi:hypothetical protein
MEDLPRDLPEFEARFSTEAACREYLFRLRWPEGFCCPRCGGRKGWPKSGVLLRCSNCEYQSSVTAGTIFQDTRQPLTLWFRAVWWVTSQKNERWSPILDTETALPANGEMSEDAATGFMMRSALWRTYPGAPVLLRVPTLWTPGEVPKIGRRTSGR